MAPLTCHGYPPIPSVLCADLWPLAIRSVPCSSRSAIGLLVWLWAYFVAAARVVSTFRVLAYINVPSCATPPSIPTNIDMASLSSSSSTHSPTTSNAPLPATGAQPSRRQFTGVVVLRRRPAVKTACNHCRRRKQRCALPAEDPGSSSCAACLEGGLECVREMRPAGTSLSFFCSVLLLIVMMFSSSRTWPSPQTGFVTC